MMTANKFIETGIGTQAFAQMLMERNGQAVIDLMAQYACKVLGQSMPKIKPLVYRNDQWHKPKMILGPAQSGKSRMAHAIAAGYSPEEVYWVNGRSFKMNVPFEARLRDCKPYTRLVIFEDMPEVNFDKLFTIASEREFEVNTKGKMPFRLSCDMIFIFDEKIKASAISSFLKNRFEVIDFSSQMIEKEV